jgi:diketogulonate reductase-like aldo/keto reductase
MGKTEFYVNKKSWEWLKQMQSEGRTRTIQISSFCVSTDDISFEVDE